MASKSWPRPVKPVKRVEAEKPLLPVQDPFPVPSAAPEVKSGKEVLWIYPGDKRPIIVLADSKESAKEKVKNSPEYDDYPIYVYKVEEFALRCLPQGERVGKTAASMRPSLSSVTDISPSAFILTKVVDGAVKEASVYTSGEKAIEEANRLSKHLSKSSGDSVSIFKIGFGAFAMQDEEGQKLVEVEVKPEAPKEKEAFVPDSQIKIVDRPRA